ncbi:MAG: DNA polymerase III subunit delta [Fermentimonas sp.]|nr:DNA polymerase III subunit delta [Fermentimonas sp.]
MAAPSHKSNYETTKNDIINRRFKPIYLLMGEESFFIDELTELLTEKVLTESEKDFNMQIFYGVDSDVNEIIASARRFPMMSEYQLIIVKEAQNLDKFDILDVYAKNPMPTTVLVISYKHGTVDKRKAVIKKIDKIGVVFESKKLYDNQIPGFIASYLKAKDIGIDAKSAQMLSDFVGNDISKLIPQLQKLEVSLPFQSPHRRITAEMIEKNVGISKDYNNFELLKAVAKKDIVSASRIVDYFSRNSKENPIMATVAVLFNYFSNLLECFWLPRKDEASVMTALNIRSSFFVRDYLDGIRNYNATKVMEIISELRTVDAASKGIDNISATHGELLKVLVYKIMH